jgi:hypothetical protein
VRELDFRQPIAARIFALAGCGGFGYRLATLSCRSRGTEMVIHNYWRTRRVAICQIAGLDIGRASAGNLWTVRVLTNAKPIAIDVLGITSGILGRRPAGAMDRLDRRRRELADWLNHAELITGAERGSVQ